MARALKAFRKLQGSAAEATPGLATAASEVFYGQMSTWPLEDLVKETFEDDERGMLARHVTMPVVAGKQADLVWEGALNMRHIIWLMSMAIRGNVTPTQPDSTNQPLAYLWTFEPGITTANTPDITNGIDTYTIEYGDNLQAYEAEYCFATRLQISGAPNELCKFTCDITGRQNTDASFTGALVAQSVQYFPFNKCKFYVNTSWATLGNTEKADLLKSFTWTLDTQFRAGYTAHNQLYFYDVVEDKKAVELELVYARNTNADAERTKYEQGTTTFLQILLEGQTELDVGQSNEPYVKLYGAYQYLGWPSPDDEDGLSTHAVRAESVFDSVGSRMFGASCLTSLAAIPT